MRVALIHYWLVRMRGGERVLEAILDLYPGAVIFTHIADREHLSEKILSHEIRETSIAKLPFAKKHYQKFLPFMPRALEELDLSEFDLVISSESGPAKGVLVRPGAPHICYCHSPMRYLYDHYSQYRAQMKPLTRRYFSHLAHRLRQWDFTTAARVDHIVANSSFIAARVRRFWGREASVVHPFANLEMYSYEEGAGESSEYFVAVSELVQYKRIDLAIEAMRGLDAKLIVVGSGEQRKALEKDSPPNVEFRGRVPDEGLRDLYRGAKALIFPGEEDFGIVPVEAMSCGTPIIAYGAGGIRDSVVENETGLFFERQELSAVQEAIARFETMTFDRKAIAHHAQSFSRNNFKAKFKSIVDMELAKVKPS